MLPGFSARSTTTLGPQASTLQLLRVPELSEGRRRREGYGATYVFPAFFSYDLLVFNSADLHFCDNYRHCLEEM